MLVGATVVVEVDTGQQSQAFEIWRFAYGLSLVVVRQEGAGASLCGDCVLFKTT